MSRKIQASVTDEITLTSQTLEVLASVEGGSKHPNILKFKGILTRLDEPSDKAPNGSEGHRIIIPSGVAQKRLSTLVGMALNSSQDYTAHAQQRKIGVINKAWIDGKDLWVEANLWVNDFPDLRKELKQPGLGMSVELSKVKVSDTNSPVWELGDFYFTGGTILKQSAAAYEKTLAIAAARKVNDMALRKIKRPIAAATDTTVTAPAVLTKDEVAVIAKDAIAEELTEVKAAQDETTTILAEIAKQLELLNSKTSIAASKDAAVSAKKKVADEEDDDEDEDEDGDVDAEVNTGDVEDLSDEDEEDDADVGATPGQLNKQAENKGDKQTTTGKVGKEVKYAVAQARKEMLNAEMNRLQAENRDLKVQLKAISRTQKAIRAQVQAAAVATDRKSVALPADLKGILSKSGVDIPEMTASGVKMSIDEFDGILSAAGISDVTARITLKNKMRYAGHLEDGRVDRALVPGSLTRQM